MAIRLLRTRGSVVTVAASFTAIAVADYLTDGPVRHLVRSLLELWALGANHLEPSILVLVLVDSAFWCWVFAAAILLPRLVNAIAAAWTESDRDRRARRVKRAKLQVIRVLPQLAVTFILFAAIQHQALVHFQTVDDPSANAELLLQNCVMKGPARSSAAALLKLEDPIARVPTDLPGEQCIISAAQRITPGRLPAALALAQKTLDAKLTRR
jgi:hypothetical protein